MRNSLYKVGLSFLGLALMAGCSGSASTQSALSCSVVATEAATTGTVLSLTVTCGGGTAPYTVSDVLLNGVTPAALTGTTAGFNPSTSLEITSSTAVATGTVGSLAVNDSSGATAVSYSFSVTSSTVSNNTGCTINVDNSAPAVNGVVNFTFVPISGWGTAPYTFSGFSAGTGSITENIFNSTGAQAQGQAQFPTTGSTTATINISDVNANLRSCSVTINVGGTSTTGTGTMPTQCTSYLSCTLAYQVQSNGLVAYTVYDSNNDALTLANFNGGVNSTVYQSGNPIYVGYTTGGQEYVTTQAYNASTGGCCNNGQPFGGYLNVSTQYGSGGTSSSGLSCSPIVPTSVTHGMSFAASVATTGGYGQVVLAQIQYPTGAALTGSFTGLTSATLQFGTSGTYQLVFIVRDQNGNQASCVSNETVY